MSELVASCPRCKAKEMTFDLVAQNHTHTRYDWQNWYETFCICRACNKSTVFVLSQKDIKTDRALRDNKLANFDIAINQFMSVEGHISLKDIAAESPPEYLPENIEAAFREGAACMSIGCCNAAATMFRLCLDMATSSMLPAENNDGLNNRVRRSLGLRLPWLFDQNILPDSLRELSSCLKDDGNDGAHEGTLSEEDAEDILDFAFVMLERVYTEPKRIELAQERRIRRRERV
ncbi:hypothetical protein A8139_09875 [Marinomonas primoryensis]|uniref:DUF4145 domain-containing protein n=1 Tax=Marinomonas primoryensis TaxID=178399 RepID=A0A2Z4PS22_9GAMM|nr:DUF4145 domain-containing protein [Marinomonas primoryensis]AWY00273.1 hypothetical protein A8139_09875 [Marinomonas primoryensis]